MFLRRWYKYSASSYIDFAMLSRDSKSSAKSNFHCITSLVILDEKKSLTLVMREQFSPRRRFCIMHALKPSSRCCTCNMQMQLGVIAGAGNIVIGLDYRKDKWGADYTCNCSRARAQMRCLPDWSLSCIRYCGEKTLRCSQNANAMCISLLALIPDDVCV